MMMKDETSRLSACFQNISRRVCIILHVLTRCWGVLVGSIVYDSLSLRTVFLMVTSWMEGCYVTIILKEMIMFKGM